MENKKIRVDEQVEGPDIEIIEVLMAQQQQQLPQLPPELICIIFGKLDRNNLLTCRLLNSYWRNEVTFILRHNKIKIVLIRPPPPLRVPCLKGQYNNKKWTMTTLIETLQKANRFGWLDLFPSTHFVFEGVNLNNSQVFKLFDLYGQRLGRLDLINSCYCSKVDGGSLTILRPLLAKCLNLEHLVINNFGKYGGYWHRGELMLLKPLPKLKILDSQYKEVVEGIRKGAANLEVFTGMPTNKT